MSRVYTVRDVAAILKVSEKTVYKLIQDQKLEVVQVRGQYRVTSGQLEDYLRGGANNGNAK